ncbi:LptF/LptG family permease [Coraliomargarita sp. SDUM461003]|uniref:LptF/LptG family permease n=1 Tax=Thalassobacterium maritimum TaxID=3041265 RepID=A0ABU1APM6_9BACT|nr:LptF/LptG family permease [Coraliomargarita sp. SDUM461003]MBT62595.1 permease [Puniceicoccaceae bacterium]MDQ8206129.1 LptF/LptG family permease [Coraliomargarita sp. SDUM461003]|tara:strand:- start:6805 stop:7917 length:1113 start_codon:yes stop_codon:yes gene_type:complete
MSLIDRYVLKEWLVGFTLTMGVIIGILILQNMYDSLPDLLDTNASFKQILFYYSLALPTYLPAILPIALLVSLLFTLGTLHRNNEIIAMRASGASLLRVSRSLWGAGLLLTMLLLYLTAYVIPKSVEQSRTFFDNLEFAADEAERDAREVGLIYNLGFDNRKDGRLWIMNRFSERAWLGLGVNVHTRDPSGQELSRISASEAYFDNTQGSWVFINGRELLLDPETGDPLRALTFKEKKFEDFDEDPTLMLALHKEPKELSLNELRRIINTVTPEENPSVRAYLVQYYSLLAAPFSCLVVVGIAVPFAVAGVRTNPMIGVSKAMGFFVIFYLLISIASILGERQIISAMLAAWLPNLVMLAMSARLFAKAR